MRKQNSLISSWVPFGRQRLHSISDWLFLKQNWLILKDDQFRLILLWSKKGSLISRLLQPFGYTLKFYIYTKRLT